MPEFDETRTGEKIELKVSDADMRQNEAVEQDASSSAQAQDAASSPQVQNAQSSSAANEPPRSYREWRSSQRSAPDKKEKVRPRPKSILISIGAMLLFFTGASLFFLDFSVLQQRWIMSSLGVDTQAMCIAQQSVGRQGIMLQYSFRDTQGTEHKAWRWKRMGDPTLAIGKEKQLRYVGQNPRMWEWKDMVNQDYYQLIYTLMLGLSFTLGGLAIGAKRYVAFNPNTGLSYVSPRLSKLASTVGASTMIFSGGTGVFQLAAPLLHATELAVKLGTGTAFAVLFLVLSGGLYWFYRTWFRRPG